ncbi:response regulator [Magnetovibrio sp.]|uniref:response regulator n=1 Tax=Magnetovibrio sp. TaxID=2024836 RepID=UPI002F956D7B
MTTLLLVEDNDLNRDMLSRRLEKMGYEVLLAVNGQEGVEMTRALAPDLILMDINMPVLDGWEAVHLLKSAPETSAIPVIALTAHAMMSDREKADEVGFDDYATKPVDFPALVHMIEALLHRNP